jgi:hypothetical protein
LKVEDVFQALSLLERLEKLGAEGLHSYDFTEGRTSVEEELVGIETELQALPREELVEALLRIVKLFKGMVSLLREGALLGRRIFNLNNELATAFQSASNIAKRSSDD